MNNPEQKSLSELREMAKAAGIKSVTTYRKAALIEKLLELEKASFESSSHNNQKNSTEQMK